MPSGLTSARVVKVVDGDTVDVLLGDKTVTLRLIGMDTPEVVDPRKPVQCFGREASDRGHQLLDGQTVHVEYDPSQGSLDKYGRTLAYVWMSDGRLYNYQMIYDGYAHEYTYDLPYKYQSQFKAAQRDAMENARGLWSPATCNGNTTQPAAGQIAATSTPAPAAPTATPSPVAASVPAAFSVTASVSNPSPSQDSDVTVTGKLTDGAGLGVAGAMMHTVWHYKTTDSTCDGGPTGPDGIASCSRRIGRATKGFTVVIDVVFTLNGQTYRGETSFTPR